VTDGNLPLEGRTIWMVRTAGTPVLVGERLGEGGQGVVHAAQIGLHLVAAFEALHGADLCYRDINPKNLWVDVDKGEVAISHRGAVEEAARRPDHGDRLRLGTGPDQRRLGTAH
jgi:hypothetical protein